MVWVASMVCRHHRWLESNWNPLGVNRRTYITTIIKKENCYDKFQQKCIIKIIKKETRHDRFNNKCERLYFWCQKDYHCRIPEVVQMLRRRTEASLSCICLSLWPFVLIFCQTLFIPPNGGGRDSQKMTTSVRGSLRRRRRRGCCCKFYVSRWCHCSVATKTNRGADSHKFCHIVNYKGSLHWTQCDQVG